MGLKKTPIIVDGKYYSSLSQAAIENEFSCSTFIKTVIKARANSFQYKKHKVQLVETVISSKNNDLLLKTISFLTTEIKSVSEESSYFQLLVTTIKNLKQIRELEKNPTEGANK